MSLLRTIRNLFMGPPRPALGSPLRNRPGGLAWIRMAAGTNDGSEVLHGCIVITLRASSEGFWTIQPEPQFVLTRAVIDGDGLTYQRGATCGVRGVHDDDLVPIPDAGITSKEVERLYSSTPQKTEEPA